MGFDARSIDRQDFWEFAAQWASFRRFHSNDTGPKPPSDAAFDQAVALSNTLH